MSPVIVSQLIVYPVKSCAGIRLDEARIEKRGFKHDRRWMIVDENGVFISQRTHPCLSLVKVNFANDNLMLSAPGMSSIALPANAPDAESVRVRVWDDFVDAIPGSKETEEWFGTFLQFRCRPVYLPDRSVRPVRSDYRLDDEEVSFADAFPFLLISEESLADLNSRLKQPLPMNRFRPNIVVKGCKPFEEDIWREITIGTTAFRVAKPCSRCVTTTVEQSTGIQGKEPLHTLSLYRNKNGKVYFGQNLVHTSLGTVHVGERVTIR